MPELNELAEIGKKLVNSLKLSKSSPNTIRYRSAWAQAEEACTRLGEAISNNLPAAVVVEAACVRVRRRRGPLTSELEDKRNARTVRS